MNPKYAIWGGLAVVLAIAAASVIWYNQTANKLTVNRVPEGFHLLSKMEKDGVPEFELTDLNGKPYRLQDNISEVTIINFWASWCAPCVEEFPSMLKLVAHMKGKVRVIAISGDNDRQDLLNFLKAFGLPQPGFDVLWDEKGTVRKTYGVEKLPESFLIKKDRRLIKKVLGIDNWSDPNALDYFANLAK